MDLNRRLKWIVDKTSNRRKSGQGDLKLDQRKELSIPNSHSSFSNLFMLSYAICLRQLFRLKNRRYQIVSTIPFISFVYLLLFPSRIHIRRYRLFASIVFPGLRNGWDSSICLFPPRVEVLRPLSIDIVPVQVRTLHNRKLSNFCWHMLWVITSDLISRICIKLYNVLPFTSENPEYTISYKQDRWESEQRW